MKRSRKIWASLNGTAAVALVGSVFPLNVVQSAEPAESVMFPSAAGEMSVEFTHALSKLLGGEGGEGGMGFLDSGPEFSIPALSDDQLKIALPGKTIRKDRALAFYFDVDGTVDGWRREWSKSASSACLHEVGEDYFVSEHGDCYTAIKHEIDGPYEIKDGRVCMPAYSGKAEDGVGCYYIGFAVKYIVIGDGNRVYGSGQEMFNGRHLDTFLHRPFGKKK